MNKRTLVTSIASAVAGVALALSQSLVANAAVDYDEVKNLTVGSIRSHSVAPANVDANYSCGNPSGDGTQMIANTSLVADNVVVLDTCDRNFHMSNFDQLWEAVPAGSAVVKVRQSTAPGTIGETTKLVPTYKFTQGWEGTSSRCLEADGSGTVGVGTNVAIYPCDPNFQDQPNQRWVLWPSGVDGVSYFVNVAALSSSAGYVEDAPRLSMRNPAPGDYRPVNGSSITLQSASATFTQGFSFRPTGHGTLEQLVATLGTYGTM